MTIKDTDIRVEKFFKTYTKEEIVSYIEDLYYIHDYLNMDIK